MKRLTLLLTLAVSTMAFAQASAKGKAKPDAAKRPEAGVNWSGQILKATGAGAPDMRATSPAQARLGAERAAKMDAFRNLLEQARGIQITAGRTVGDEMAKDEVRGRVEGVIRGYKVANTRYFSDQGVELDVEVPLSALAAIIPASDAKIAINEKGEAKNTGLVVDARGLGVTPALAPRLLDESGVAVYAADCLSEEAKQTTGVASYFKSLDEAQKSSVVGAKPLVVKASRVEGSDLVLTAADLKRLGETNNSYLTQGRVAIVTN